MIDKIAPATKEQLLMIHSAQYLEFVDTMWPQNTKKKQIYMTDTYINPYSQEAAHLAAGGILHAVDQVVQDSWQNAFCVIRPPGHHSGKAAICAGFCFFNNVALGVRYAQKKYGVKKCAIVDWDIHHGDGTHFIFEEDPSVLFISLHRFDDGTHIRRARP